VQQALDLSREDIARLATNSVTASFLPIQAKRILLGELEAYIRTH